MKKYPDYWNGTVIVVVCGSLFDRCCVTSEFVFFGQCCFCLSRDSFYGSVVESGFPYHTRSEKFPWSLLVRPTAGRQNFRGRYDVKFPCTAHCCDCVVSGFSGASSLSGFPYAFHGFEEQRHSCNLRSEKWRPSLIPLLRSRAAVALCTPTISRAVLSSMRGCSTRPCDT